MIDRYIWGLIPEIRRDVTSSKPTTLKNAIGMAYCLTNDVIRSGGLTKGNDNGQKRQGDQQGNRDQDQQDKRQRVARNYGAATQERRGYAGPHPECIRCNLHHSGDCPKCNVCQRTGHLGRNCSKRNGNQERRRTCYECGSLDHLWNTCPRLNRAQRPVQDNSNLAVAVDRSDTNRGGNISPARGRAYVLGTKEAR
ncbi:reverse transcriptase domain-containing protein [Artemisia annua]|uniref:Reverse transcriptase domain-containing protein n=1 Tax=Artemisia annua TaxID=35608 RepID=A0A2U1N0B9_ARTAN|nr:reverse transcriptase domain-containing protein [Artemisia annua]